MQARIPQALARGAGEPTGERRGALDRLAAAAREGQAVRAAPFPPDGRGAPAPGPRRPAGHLARVRRGARRQARLRQQLLHRSRGQRGQRGADRAGRPGALEDRERGLHEGFNCLARHGRNFKRNFGHGKDGPANVPAVPNPFAFALHAVVQRVCALRQQCRRKLVTRRALFRELQVALRRFRFPDWPTVAAGYRRSASGRGLGTRPTRDAGRATALPAVRPSRGAASGAQPLGQLIHLILRNNVHAPP